MEAPKNGGPKASQVFCGGDDGCSGSCKNGKAGCNQCGHCSWCSTKRASFRSVIVNLLVELAHWVQGQQKWPNLASLKTAVMGFEHNELIKRMVTKYEWTHERATTAFEGMKQYLFLAGTTRGKSLSPQTQDVDECWHNFMLFSADYQAFCFKFFGFFLHHQPFTEKMKAADDGQGGQNTREALKAEFAVDCTVNCAHSCGGGCSGKKMVGAQVLNAGCTSDCHFKAVICEGGQCDGDQKSVCLSDCNDYEVGRNRRDEMKLMMLG